MEVQPSTVENNEKTAEPESQTEVDPLDELKDLDFLLEDIEDKIAPLALTVSC